MRAVAALGGNALLRRGQLLTVDNQRQNIKIAAAALAPLVDQYDLVITHGNGPQVGLLTLQNEAYQAGEHYPLDVLDAETEGMIGYLIEQELCNLLPAARRCVTVLTQIEVRADDPAFAAPSKPIGPGYGKAEAQQLAQQRGWQIAADGEKYRRVVASPRPQRILELGVIELLVEQGVIVICAGGGGIPVVRATGGRLSGVEAVIDKDAASALLARELKADALLMLTDVEAVYSHWGDPDSRSLRRLQPGHANSFRFASGSMAPKIAAACEFVQRTGGIAGIGRLQDAQGILAGDAGTLITTEAVEISYWN